MLSAYFGFQKDPFSSTADSAFFIAHSSIKEAVGSLLFSQLSQRKGLTLITGEGGVGKTALLSSILEQDRAEGSSIYLSCGEDWSFGTLLERWSDELGIRDQVSVQEARIHAVIDFLSARSQQGNPVSTLLLDQAENLTDDALEGLTEFSKIESGGSALVQAILAARPEIGARLDHPKLQKVANGIVFRARLEPIKESEVGDYVRHRLRIAGYEGPALFSDDAIETVADASRGIAAHVNLLCHTALQLAELEQEKSVTAATAEQAIEVCTKYLSDRTDDTGGTAGDRPGHGTEQDALVGNSSLVGLALKERARTDDEIWPMQLDAGQPDTGQAEARQPSTRQPSTRQQGTGQPDFGRLDTGPLETGPVVLDEAWSSAVAETETSQGRRRSAGLWPVVGFVAVALMTGAGVAWYRLPTDSIARERPDVSEQLAFRQDETDAGTSETQAEPPAGEQVVLAQGAADRVSSEAQTEPPAGEQPASQQDETNAVIEAPKVEPPASPVPQTAQVLKAPRLVVTAAEGYEDQAIPVEIQLQDVDQALAQRPSLTLSGLPPGTILSAGRQEADGTWRLDGDDLPGLTLATPTDYSGSFKGEVTARVGASDDDSGLATARLPVRVTSVADTPFLETADATGKEDQPIPLDLRAELADADGSERLTVQLEGLPDGASLTAGRSDSRGTWTLPHDQLKGLQLIPPKDFSGSLQITASATALERGNRDEATAMAALTVTVLGVADPPRLEIKDVRGEEDQSIALNFDASLADSDNSEELEILLSGLPEGTKLSGGELLRDGSWKIGTAQLASLSLTPPDNFSGIFPMTVEAISHERDNGDRAVTTEKQTIEVLGIADAPKLTAEGVSGREDTPIPLEVAASLVDQDGSEELAVMLSATPEEVRFSAGTENGNGAWVLRPDQLPGLRLYPPADFSGTVDVTIDAFAKEKDSDRRAKATREFKVSVVEVADPPYLAVKDAEGQADQPIPLHVMARLSDLDGSEKLIISLAGLPSGTRLSAGQARAGGDWILTAEQLPGLKLLPPASFYGSFQVTAQATTWEAGGDKASLSAPFEVLIAAAPETVEVLEESAAEKIDAIYIPAPDLTEPATVAPEVTESALVAPENTEAATVAPEVTESALVVPENAEADLVAPQSEPSVGRLTERGNELLALGDVVSARLFYELALEQGEQDAVTAIAKTFDPLFLTRMGVRRSLGDRAKAIEWYRRSADAGDAEAILRLKELAARPE